MPQFSSFCFSSMMLTTSPSIITNFPFSSYSKCSLFTFTPLLCHQSSCNDFTKCLFSFNLNTGQVRCCRLCLGKLRLRWILILYIDQPFPESLLVNCFAKWFNLLARDHIRGKGDSVREDEEKWDYLRALPVPIGNNRAPECI